MPFIRKIVKELNCPRCNAWAKLFVMEERGEACIVYLICDKCKLNRYHSVISRKALNLMSQEEKLRARIEEIKPGRHRTQLIARLNVVRETIRKENRKIGA